MEIDCYEVECELRLQSRAFGTGRSTALESQIEALAWQADLAKYDFALAKVPLAERIVEMVENYLPVWRLHQSGQALRCHCGTHDAMLTAEDR
jgi:hypothetical protein